MRSHEHTASVDDNRRATNLRSLLFSSTESLVPSSHYGLKLFGVKTPPLLLKQFEQQFRRSVDLDKGLDLNLKYDVLEKSFAIRSLACSLEKGSSKGMLLNTEHLGFVPTIQTDGDAEANSLEIFKWNGAEILKEVNIDSPPLEKAPEYTIWRSNLLRKTAGWVLQEYAEYTEGNSQAYEQKIIVANEERVGKNTAESTKIQSVRRSIETYSPNGTTVDGTHATIELETAESNQRLHTYRHRTHTEIEPFVLNESHTHQVGRKESLDIKNDDIYFSCLNVLEAAVEHVRQEKKLLKKD